uniref:glutathione transferase n=2 Tax=Opuntia streptacantha TaxID=393608 RepID=A0A7C9DE10_OPUST
MAGQQEVKLHGMWRSPFSRRIETALKLKGIPYDYIHEDLPNKSPDLLKYNPIYKKVPVLVHNGKPIVESQIILEYIDETWPGYSILPQDRYERAMARFWAKFIDDKCLPAAMKATWGPEHEQDKALEEVQESLSFLEKAIEGKKFFGGESIGFVDIVGNVIAHWLVTMQEAAGKEMFTKEKHPCLYKWAQEYTSCTVIKDELPPRDILVDFFKARIQASKASK